MISGRGGKAMARGYGCSLGARHPIPTWRQVRWDKAFFFFRKEGGGGLHAAEGRRDTFAFESTFRRPAHQAHPKKSAENDSSHEKETSRSWTKKKRGRIRLSRDIGNMAIKLVLRSGITAWRTGRTAMGNLNLIRKSAKRGKG